MYIMNIILKYIYKTTAFSFFLFTKISFTILFFVAHAYTVANMDASHPWQIGFQDPATPIMEGIIFFNGFLMALTFFIVFYFVWVFGSLLFGKSYIFSNLFFFVCLGGLFLFSCIFLGTLCDESTVAYCATEAEVVSDNSIKELKDEKPSGLSTKNVGLCIGGILIVAFLFFGGGGCGGGGSELLSAVGQSSVIDDVLPIAAAAAVAASAPAVVEIVIDTTPTSFALSVASQEVLASNLASLEVSNEFAELARSRSTDYYLNFIEALRQPSVWEIVGYLLTEDSLGNLNPDFTNLAETLRSSPVMNTESLHTYSRFVGSELLDIAILAAKSSVGGFVLLSEVDLLEIVPTLALTAIKALQDSDIVVALVDGNGYDVIASCLLETLEWTFAHTLIEPLGVTVAMDTFTNILNGQNVADVLPFIISGIQVFKSVLVSRTNCGDSIQITDAYVLVMLLSDILKAFIKEEVYWFFDVSSAPD